MHPLQFMIERRKRGILCGIPSYCTANELALEAAMERAMRFDDYVLIEATANQVNQYGGYTGMQPKDFFQRVHDIAGRVGFDQNKLILGGDHLGPLTWKNEPASTAMEKAEILVYEYTAAGFSKIHLDTSMRLGDDPIDERLSTKTVAARGARLFLAAEKGFAEWKKIMPQAEGPVYVIGSEVPVPGGTQEDEEIQVTSPKDFNETIDAYSEAFAEAGISNAFEKIIAVVVQPGVEFGDSVVHPYSREAAKNLCKNLSNIPGLVFEGHSTDYQTEYHLRQMVEDGIAILKVGPALTFALRESLYSLNHIENELITDEKNRSHFIAVLEQEMQNNPGNWKQYYHGSDIQITLARKYSFSDRCRYYLGLPRVQEAINKLFINLNSVEIPLGILHQYMPVEYRKVTEGRLALKARELAKSGVSTIADEYVYAAKPIRAAAL